MYGLQQLLPQIQIARLCLPLRRTRPVHTTASAQLFKSIFKRNPPRPPTAPAVPVATEWHGVLRNDEFSWMEDPSSESRLIDYIRDESNYATQLLKPTQKLQQQLLGEMSRALEVDNVPPPIETEGGGFVYYAQSKDDGSVLYCRRVRGSGTSQVLMDSGALMRQSGLELRSLLISDCHRWMGCLVSGADSNGDGKTSESGSLRIYRLDDNGVVRVVETLKDVFNFVFGIGDELFYTVLDEKLRAHKILAHNIGAQQGSDQLVLYEGDPESFIDITRTKDKRYHIINSSTLDSSELYVFKSDDRSAGVHLVRPRQRGVEYYIDHHNNEFIVLTNSPCDNNDIETDYRAEPPPFRLVHCPSSSLAHSSTWHELVSVQADEKIEDVELFKNFLAIHVKRRGRPEVFVYNRETGGRSKLPLPYNGDCSVKPEPNPQYDSENVRLSFSSPVHLESVVEYDMRAMRASQSWVSTPLHIDPREFAIKHVSVSVDKHTSVPLTLVQHESAAGGSAPSPMLVRVYGAYGVSLEPEFRLEDIPLLTRGWSIALVHVRGGGELGRAWYAGGRGARKTNSIADLLASVKFLFDKGWCEPGRLGATAVSAGGLVLGSALNMHPEYFRAAALHVPFVDPLSAMLTPDLPLTGVEISEWGNPVKSRSDFECIAGYAPYDNIRHASLSPGLAPPSILVTAGGQDQRVSVWQPAKWVARMRSIAGYGSPCQNLSSADGAPQAKLLFKADMEAGHFHSSSASGQGHDGNGANAGFMKAMALRNAFLLSEVK